ncbi:MULTISPECIES: LysR family transcriptional regulator [Legionella]|uniref:LysR family transcriptional regulator n=1 Tax=Legionella resiliens TaxID=2905958 RepID=A0ABS8X2C5_9GAMM|nr:MULTISPECIES: LysR family transcriptional regulator [unclassified Legionella]MCE0723746.1 LysR family transcriptional regulator [Legionella sp. 9fVS26]MCE3532898.1 LysR family transcriptional regulator [Legionella sp. 8cVS16]QLZ69086.1 LysR family transcriptional regulator [Legionella sp. PC1000]
MILLDPQLVAFEAIVREGTVHAAAESLFLTQTAVTQRLRQLEQKLKTTLFIRSRRGMLLTAEGEQLHRYCQRVTEMSSAVLTSIQGAGTLSNLRIKIAGPASVMRSRIIPQCKEIMKEFPKLHMTFLIDDHMDISHQLKSGAFDLVILSPEQVTQEMVSKPLQPEHYLLVCSVQWEHRKLIDIISNEKIIDFGQDDQMTFSYLKKYKLLKYIQTERHFINNTESIAQLFINELGYGVLSKEFAASYIKSGELLVINEGKSYLNPISLAWYPRSEQPAYFSAIIHAIN